MRLYVLTLFSLAAVVSPACTQDMEQQIRSEVLAVVEHINSGDATGLADMYLREPTVGSLGDGQITRGWDAVSDLLSLFVSGAQRIAVDSVTVTPLGRDAAIAYFRYYLDFTTGDAVAGAMTIVFLRVADDWKIAHDHTSTLLATGAAALPYSGPSGPVRSTSECTVTRIVDGDTIECQELGRVRLIGMDTPEADQEPYGSQATQVLYDLIAGSSSIELELDVEGRDQYGRVLGYVWADGQMLNWLLVRLGYAVVLTYPPNVQYVDWFTAAQQAAQQDNAGLWAVDGFSCLPRDHRRGRCD